MTVLLRAPNRVHSLLVAAAVHAPKTMDTLGERILPEPKIHEMIALTPEGRDRMLLRLLYATGAPVSEICALKWRHVQSNTDTGQVTLSVRAERLTRFCCLVRSGTI